MGWVVRYLSHASIIAHRGIAIREFPLPSHGFADFLLYIEGIAADVIEAERIETPSDK